MAQSYPGTTSTRMLRAPSSASSRNPPSLDGRSRRHHLDGHARRLRWIWRPRMPVTEPPNANFCGFFSESPRYGIERTPRSRTARAIASECVTTWSPRRRYIACSRTCGSASRADGRGDRRDVLAERERTVVRVMVIERLAPQPEREGGPRRMFCFFVFFCFFAPRNSRRLEALRRRPKTRCRAEEERAGTSRAVVASRYFEAAIENPQPQGD